jgi:hypothetical protein
MVLAHAEQLIATGMNDKVGIAQLSCWRQRLGLAPGFLNIQSLIGKIREHNRSA